MLINDVNAGKNVKGGRARHPLFYAGTLVYSRAGLAWVFMWLLWGDFCFSMMEAVVPSIIPLRLKELMAPDWILGFVLATIPGVLNMILNPIISTASDRHRGRFGRRIPFMLFTVPCVFIALCLMAFSSEIGAFLHNATSAHFGWSAAAVTVGVIAVAVGFFKFSDMFVNTVFWYFFNDVVPTAVMARFLGLFRMVGAGVGVLYNYFVFKYALSNLRIIFLGVATLYLLGFTMMCLMVKEGTYPPPEKSAKRRRNFQDVIGAYFRECLNHRIYHFFYLQNMCWTLSIACDLFLVFLYLSLGLTLGQIGTIAAAVAAANFLFTYPIGALADRFHPLRVMLWIKCALVLIAPLNLIWLFTHFSSAVNFQIVIILAIIKMPLQLIYTAVGLPMTMSLLPRDRFGQFCSFNAICGAAVGALAGLVGGAYIDLMRKLFPNDIWGADFCYRLIPVWNLPFLLMSLIFLVLLYRRWKDLGGVNHYVPPGGSGKPLATLFKASPNLSISEDVHNPA